MHKLLMDCCEVNRNKAVGFQKSKEFIKKVVWIVAERTKKVVNIIMLKDMWLSR